MCGRLNFEISLRPRPPFCAESLRLHQSLSRYLAIKIQTPSERARATAAHVFSGCECDALRSRSLDSFPFLFLARRRRRRGPHLEMAENDLLEAIYSEIKPAMPSLVPPARVRNELGAEIGTVMLKRNSS